MLGGIAGKLGFLSPNRRGINGALLDLEYQRIELLVFNLFDNSGTYEEYARSQQNPSGSLARIWPQFRLPKDHPLYRAVSANGSQKCNGELIRFRTTTGICNDIWNPLMGSTGERFARNMSFEATFPDFALDELVKNRHAGRLGLPTRIGLEDTLVGPDAEPIDSNADLVALAVRLHAAASHARTG